MHIWKKALIGGIAVTLSYLVTINVRALTVAPGDLLVYQTRNDSTGGANAGPVSILEINPQTLALAQTFTVSTQSSPLFSTLQDPIENVALSDGGQEISFAGWTSAGTSGLLGTTPNIPRGAGVINTAGNYSQPSKYNPAVLSTPDQPHAAYSPDGANWYFGDTHGMYYNNGTTPLTNSDATLAIKGFGSQTYALHTLSTEFVPPNGNDGSVTTQATVLSTVTPASPGPSVTSITYNPVVAVTGAHDFALVSSFNQAPDTLYLTTNTGVSKYGLISGTWTAEGTDTINGATGIAALEVKGVGVELFVTTDIGGPPATSETGKLEEITDSAGPSAAINASTPAVLFAAGNLNTLEGVSLAPVPEPASLGVLGAALVFVTMKRR